MGIGGMAYCLLKGWEACFGVDDLTYIDNLDQIGDAITARSPYAHAPACASCAMRVVCPGVQDVYLQRLGDDELAPYAGALRTRRVASPIVSTMFPELLWTPEGVSSSLFAEHAGTENVAS